MPQGQYSDADVQTAAAPVQHGQYTDADVLPEQSFAAGAKEFTHQMGGFFSGLYDKAKGAVSALLPDDPSKAAVNAPIRVLAGAAEAIHNHIENLNSLRDKAEESLSKGEIADFLGHMQAMSVEGLFPGIGGAVDATKAKYDSGDKVGAIADAAALTSQMLIAAKSGDLARAGLNAGAYGIAGTRAAAPGIAGGLAKAAVGEVLAKVPGMELPARFGLQYPALREVSRSMGKFAEAGRAAIAPEAAAEATATATPSAAAGPAVAAKTPGQLLAEQDGKTWAKVPKAEKQLYETIATERAKGEANVAAEGPNIPKPPRDFAEHYGVPATQQAVPRGTTPQPAVEVPPSTPIPSAPVSAQPAPAAAPKPTNVPEQLKTSGRTFIKDPRPSAEDYTLVQVPTKALDAGWAKEGSAFYIPPGGGGAEIGGRLPAAKQFIESGQPIEAPRVSMAENGRVAFEDGRHRFAAVRDAGDKTTAVMVPNEQVDQFEALNKPATGAQTPADIAKAAQAKTKGDRFVAAIQRYNIDFPDREPITAASLERLGDEGKSILTRALKSGNYLKNTETFTDTSFPYIVQGLKDAESGGNLAQQLAESIRRARANRASAGR